VYSLSLTLSKNRDALYGLGKNFGARKRFPVCQPLIIEHAAHRSTRICGHFVRKYLAA
jgi:hypothetical protein